MAKQEIKRIALTDDQYDLLHLEFKERDCLCRLLAATAEEIAERLAYREKATWDSVFRLAGYDRRPPNVELSIDWFGREIVVRSREREDTP